MRDYRVYLLGFRENDFTQEEQVKLDSHIAKWNSSLLKDNYKPIDSRSNEFQNVAETYEDEGPRKDGKRITLFQELAIDENKDKPQFLEAINELRSLFPGMLVEAHDDDGIVS